MTPVAFATDLTKTRDLINARLEAYCLERTAEAANHGSGYVTLWHFITKLLLAGGKRFRPYILLTVYQAYAKDGNKETVLSAALAQELIHFAMLVHDDIIDRDLTRYGVRNVMGQYEDFYASFIDDASEKTHMARSAAILAGDILLSDAYRLIGRVDVPKQLVAEATEIMSRAVFEVVGGELLDTEAAFIQDPLITAKSIALHKTASYSFVGPITMGAVLAGASKEEVKILQAIAERLGVGYQLRDDLLGVFGSEEKTGKSVSSDITEGKRTYLVEQFEQCASSKQHEEFFKVFHNIHASERDIAHARKLLIASGAKAAVETEIAHLVDDTTGLIETLCLTESDKQTFYALVDHCLQREG